MSSIVNLYRKRTSNVGDRMCAPSLWFPELADSVLLDILGYHAAENPEPGAVDGWIAALQDAETIIIGGGGLLEIPFFRPAFDFIFSHRNVRSKVVLWGAGHNNWYPRTWRDIKQPINIGHYPFDLIGIRDYGYPYEWVPCSSCMSPMFDQNFTRQHEVVVFAHAETLRHPELAGQLPKEFPILDNNATLEETLQFLASADLVLTDSYHGMIWSTLLSRRVIAFASSSKFYSSGFPVPLCHPSDWKQFEPMARLYPEALEISRARNRSFLSAVLDAI